MLQHSSFQGMGWKSKSRGPRSPLAYTGVSCELRCGVQWSGRGVNTARREDQPRHLWQEEACNNCSPRLPQSSGEISPASCSFAGCCPRQGEVPSLWLCFAQGSNLPLSHSPLSPEAGRPAGCLVADCNRPFKARLRVSSR